MNEVKIYCDPEDGRITARIQLADGPRYKTWCKADSFWLSISAEAILGDYEDRARTWSRGPCYQHGANEYEINMVESKGHVVK